MLNMLEVFGIDPDGIGPDRPRWTSLDAYTTMTTVLSNPVTGVVSSCWKILDIGVYHCQSMAWAALWSQKQATSNEAAQSGLLRQHRIGGEAT